MKAVDNHQTYTVSVVKDDSAFKALEGEWNDIFMRSGMTNPFLSYDWMYSWWSAYCDSGKLNILIVRKNGYAVAIVPFIYKSSMFFKWFEFIASDRSDYLGFISDQPTDRILNMVLMQLAECGQRWDFVKLANMDLEDPGYVSLFQLVEERRVKFLSRVYSVAPFLSIEGGWELYLKERGHDFLKKIKKKEARLLKKGKVEVVSSQEHICHDPRIGDVFETAKVIEMRGWKYKEGNPRIQTDRHSETFFKDFLARFSERGWLKAWFVIMDDMPIAYAFNFLVGKKVYAYNSSYDERFRENAPGALLHIYRIRDAFESGYKEYDFLRGAEAYKYEWTSQQRKIHEIMLFNNNKILSLVFAYIFYSIRNRLAESSFIRNIRERIIRWNRKKTISPTSN